MEDQQSEGTQSHPNMPTEDSKKVESNNVINKTSGKDVLKDNSHYKSKYNLKDLKIQVARCDKIWETLKLIQNIQQPNQKQTAKCCLPRRSLPTTEPSPSSPTKYTIRIMGRRRIFHCNVCGKNYCGLNSLRHHLFVVHQYHVPPGKKGLLFNHDKSRAQFIERIPVTDNRKRKLAESCENVPARKKVKVEPKESLEKQVVEEKTVSETLIKCVLCKHVAKNIKKHITDYHKIKYPDLIVDQCMKEHEKKVDQSGVEAKVKVEPPKKRVFVGSLKRSKVQVKKLRTPVPEVVNGLYSCPKCPAGFDNLRGYANHQRVHLGISGQRKRIIKKRKKPLKKVAKVTKPVEKKIQDSCLEIKKEKVKEKEEPQEDAKEESKKEQEEETTEETLCECGRSFRHPHTLFLHKAKCQWTKFGDSSSVTKNGSDGDSGSGINITIKKKNNSYEIVPREKSTTSTETSSVNSASGEENEKDDGKPEKTAFFKDTNIVLLQTVEDDEDVDIEDDTANKFGNHGSPECSSSGGLSEPNGACQLSEVNSCTEATSTVSKPFIPLLKEVCRKSVTADDPHLSMDSLKPKGKPKPKPKYKSSDVILSLPIEAVDSYLPKEQNLPMLKSRRRGLEQQCHCGRKFRSTYYLNLHVKKLHPNLLDCSYCETTLENYSDFDSHDCDVKQIAKTDENLFKLQCPECKDYLEFSFESFDRHTMAQHFNPSLPYQCFLCGERFENVSKRKLHFRRHPIPPCKKCNLRLHYEYQIKHNLYHQGIGYPCHKCKRAYSKKTVMIKHKSQHLKKSEGRVTCDICAKDIKSSAFKKHKYMHTVEYSCQKCGEIRLGVSKLQLHIDQKHKDDYPYVSCKCCKMVFALNTQLDKHIASGDCLAYKNEMVARMDESKKEEFVPGKTSICVADSSGTLAMSSGASDDEESLQKNLQTVS